MGNNIFQGKYCSGTGDIDFLELIEDSFEMMHPSPRLPNISMLYNQEQDTFAEGFFWNGWWIQNSYGFSYCAIPFLSEPWITILQNSLDLFWDRIGDGKRCGADNDENTNNKVLKLVAPDGCLGDCVAFNQGIYYKQGDGKTELHDWFYEATAAGVIIQAELLFRAHNTDTVNRYLPLMERSCNFIEQIRDKENNLFLAGPASNLLAPSYGGTITAKGTIDKGYPSGIAITYTAALQRMCELFRMAGNIEKEAEYENKLEITIAALPLLLTEEGYFVKSIEKDGTKHGVYGQSKYGYFEGVANADAIAFNVVCKGTAERIYDKINSIKGIRPYDFLLTNYPSLDDTYEIYLNNKHTGFFMFGDWVNGGCWGTVEGRAILGYLKLNKFDDVFASASRAMMWAKEYRMDAPFSQFGKNSNNPWSDRKGVSPISVMVDNFAIPAATIRGLFEYNYAYDNVTLIPHIPANIRKYTQHEPVVFGEKKIYISVINGSEIRKVTVNGILLENEFSKGIVLDYKKLPPVSFVSIDMDDLNNGVISPTNDSVPIAFDQTPDLSNLPENLKSFYIQFNNILTTLNEKSEIIEQDKQYAFAYEVMYALKACALRFELPFNLSNNLRYMSKQKQSEIENLYMKTAESLAHAYLKTYGDG